MDAHVAKRPAALLEEAHIPSRDAATTNASRACIVDIAKGAASGELAEALRRGAIAHRERHHVNNTGGLGRRDEARGR